MAAGVGKRAPEQGPAARRARRPGGAARRLLLLESLGFGLLTALVWAEEVFDLPHLLFGAVSTPVNWVESLLETGFVLSLYGFVAGATLRCLRRIGQLEGLLPICSFCKRIRSDGEWVALERYIGDRSRAEFSHGLCAECARREYGYEAVARGCNGAP